MYLERYEHTIARMAKVLKVSESGYYKWKTTHSGITSKELDDIKLLEEIKEIYYKSKRVFGIRKVTKRLNRQRSKEGKERVNHKRVERIMREYDLHSKNSRKYRVTTDSNHNMPVHENLLARDFNADSPDEKFVSDTTVVSTNEGDLYAAAILDLYGRMPVGLSLSKHNDRFLVLEALKEMLIMGHGKKGSILHSDQGSTYCSEAYQQAIERAEMICSMSRKGNCWDNAPMESFWGKMKSEWLLDKYDTIEEAAKDIQEYVWKFYPYERPHASLDYLTPVEYITENR